MQNKIKMSVLQETIFQNSPKERNTFLACELLQQLSYCTLLGTNEKNEKTTSSERFSFVSSSTPKLRPKKKKKTWNLRTGHTPERFQLSYLLL